MVHLTLVQIPLKVVHDWLKSEYQTEVPDPYLIAQRRAELGTLEVLLLNVLNVLNVLCQNSIFIRTPFFLTSL